MRGLPHAIANRSPTSRTRPRDATRTRSRREKLWACLRNRQLADLKFRRQVCIGPFIADFYCAGLLLIVELDGDSHADRLAYDAERTTWLENNGYRVIRFYNHDVQKNLVEVLEAILSESERIRGNKKDPSP